MRLISSARISIAVSLRLALQLLEGRVFQLLAEPLELRLEAAVPDRGADLRDDAAQDGRVGARFEHERVAGGLGERTADTFELVRSERLGARDHPADPSDLRVDEIPVAASDVWKLGQAVPIDEQAEEAHQGPREGEPLREYVDELLPLLLRVAGVLRERSRLARVGDGPHHAVERLADLLVLARFQGEAQERLGVAARDACDHLNLPRMGRERRGCVTWPPGMVNAAGCSGRSPCADCLP